MMPNYRDRRKKKKMVYAQQHLQSWLEDSGADTSLASFNTRIVWCFGNEMTGFSDT